MPELWKDWGGGIDVVTGRNLLIERMRMFATSMDVEIDPYICIKNKVMKELIKGNFTAGDLVPRFKDLERGNSILICAP